MANDDQTVDTAIDNNPSPAPAEPSTLDSVDDIVSALDAGDNAAGDNAGDETETKPGEQPDDDGQNGEGEGQGQPAAPTEPAEVPMPEGFSADTWGKLAPEARSAVHAMAEAHAQAIAQERQTVLTERADRDNQINAAGTLLNNANQLLQMITDAEYRGIDWAQLSQTDPASYVQLSRQYAQRREAIQQLGARIRQTAQAVAAKRAQEYQQNLAAEYQTVEPKIRALIGDGYDGKKYTAEVYQYMKEAGIPDKAINSLSKGYELELVTKAMLYDKMGKARAAAAQKVADAPKVQAPSGVRDDTASVQKQAFARFYKNPNSTDALAAALAAMD